MKSTLTIAEIRKV